MTDLATLGRRDATTPPCAPGQRPGRVAVVHGATADVLWVAPDGVRTTHARLARDLPLVPVAGDWVALADDGHGTDVVTALEPRTTALTRPDPDGSGTQVLAANVDLVLVVVPVERDLNERMLERLSVMAWDSGAAQTIVLTKADAVPHPGAYADRAQALAPGVDVVLTSARTGEGIDVLRALLSPGVTATMLGASGAGKTSLLNAVEGRSEPTREVRRDGEGRHTTTTRRLYRLASGGVLLDLPGIRSLDLAASPEAVDGAFADVADLARGCRFADCAHDGEPGCAVEEALAEGLLDERRLTSWRAVQRELAYQERRADPAKAAEQRALWKSRTKAYRALTRDR